MDVYFERRQFQGAFKAALSEMAAYKGRTFLGIIGIALGVATLVVSVGAVQGAFRAWEDFINENGGLERLSIYYKREPSRQSNTPGLTRRSSDLIARLLAVEVKSTPVVTLQVRLKNIQSNLEASSDFAGVNENAMMIQRVNLVAGRFLTPLEIARSIPVVVVSEDTASHLGYPKSCVDSLLLVNNRPFKIVGVYGRKLKDKRLPFNPRYTITYAPISVVSSIVEYGDYVSGIELAVRDPQKLLKVEGDLTAVTKFSRYGVDDFEIHSRQDEFNVFRKTENTMTSAGWIVSIMILSIGGIGIANVMLASINERVREIGVRYALGATSSHIVTQFLFEAVAVTSVGTGVGTALSLILLPLAGAFLPDDIPGHPILVPWVLAIAVVTSVGVGLLSGVYPALRAGKLNPVEAIRNE